MKRYVKTLCLLLAALLLLLSEIDSALDRLAVAPEQGAFALYNKKGETLFSYRGNLALCKLCTHPLRARLLPARSGLAPRA